jgi:hypothetical protein
MDIVCTDKCWYKFQEWKEVPVWYTGIYRPILNTACVQVIPQQDCTTDELFTK